MTLPSLPPDVAARIVELAKQVGGPADVAQDALILIASDLDRRGLLEARITLLRDYLRQLSHPGVDQSQADDAGHDLQAE